MAAKPVAKPVAKTRAPRQASTPAGETKAQKFVRLAEARVSKALKAISTIGNLGGANYEKNAAQVHAIESALHDAVDEAIVKLSATKAVTKETGFKF